MGYKILIYVYTDHSPITEIFKGRNLSGRLARWYLTIQTYNPEIKYTKGSSNVVTDSLSRNIHVGAVTDTSPITNFSLERLEQCLEGRPHLEEGHICFIVRRGNPTTRFAHSFLSLFLSQDKVLCRYGPQKPVPVEQLVIPEKFVSPVLSLIHDIKFDS